jgi:Tfp pilus assembly protein PilO
MMRMIFGILALVIAAGVFFVYTQPTYDAIQKSQKEIAQYDIALSKAKELQEIKQQLLTRNNAFRPTDLDRLHKLLPDHVDNVRLVLDMDNLATRYGLALQNVDVSGPTASAAAPAAPAGKAGANQQVASVGAIGGGAVKYDSLQLHFMTNGTYSTFTDFIKALESSLRIVDLVSLSVMPGPVQQTASGALMEPSYTYDITIKTYWLK